VTQEVEMEKEPDEPIIVSAEPTEDPPPFQPDPELIAYLEHDGKPTELEVEEMTEKANGVGDR
jgi:hypothetical protein